MAQAEPFKKVVINQDVLNQGPLLFVFFLSIYLLFALSQLYPWSVQTIDLTAFDLPLPLFGIFPLIIGARLIHTLLDKRVVLTDEYLNFIEGRLSWKEKTIRVGYDHIREIEIDNTLYQKMLGVGDLGITAIATTLEPTIKMPGVRNPRKIKDIIRQRIHALEALNPNKPKPY